MKVHDEETFTKTRVMLSLWYCGILLFIILAFSIALYTTETRNFARVVLARDYGSHLPTSLSRFELRELALQVRVLRASFVTDIILIDAIVLFVGGCLSYVLAGKTLMPIQKALMQQKAFLADVSHELRTPLASMQTAAEVVLRSRDKTKDDYRKVVEQTYVEIKRLSQMATDLLLLSRFDARNIALDFKKISLSAIVKQSIDQLQPLALKKQLSIDAQIKEHVQITADEGRIKQLFLIFLDNAIKFTPRGGKVTITLTASPRAILRIADTGEGITKYELEHIFDRFYQADHSRSSSGAGLGLAIAKSIADLHSAIIHVDSTPKNGATFTITF